MAVSRTVSFPDELFQRLLERGISPSKAAQIGAKVCIEGGVDVLERKNRVIKELQGSLEAKRIHNEELIKKVARFESEKAELQKRLDAIELMNHDHENCPQCIENSPGEKEVAEGD